MNVNARLLARAGRFSVHTWRIREGTTPIWMLYPHPDKPLALLDIGHRRFQIAWG